MPTPPKGAKWIEPPKIVTRLNYPLGSHRLHRRIDPPHLRDSRRRRHAASDHERRLERTPRPNFSPDGKWIAFSSPARPRRRALRSESRTSTRRTSRRARSSSSRSRNGTSNGPKYSPDGKLDRVHVRGLRRPLGVGGDEAVRDECRRLESRTSCRATSIARSRESCGPPTTAACTSTSRAKARRISTSRRTAGQFRQVTSGKHLLTVTAVGKTGLAVGMRSTPTKPNDVVDVLDVRRPRRSVRVHAAHRGERRRARRQGARADRGGLVHVEGRSQDPGLDREAAGLRRDEEVSADSRHPRRTAGDVQRRVQLRAAGSRRERLRRAVHEPARLARATARSSRT